MPTQKRQSLLVKLFDLLVNGGVSTAFKDDELRPFNAGVHRSSKTGGCGQVIPAKGDQRRGGDLAELRFNVMGFHGIRLLDKGFQGLRGAAADKSCEGLNIIRLGSIEFGRKTPRENSQYHP